MRRQPNPGEMLLTIFLKHGQSMNLAEINRKLEATGFWQKFPPDGAEVVSLVRDDGHRPGGDPEAAGRAAARGQPRDRAVRLGAFETEFYPTYDFRPVWQGIRARAAGS